MSFKVQVQEAFDALVESLSVKERNLLSCVESAKELAEKAFLEGYLQGMHSAAAIYKGLEAEPEPEPQPLELPCTMVAPGHAVIINHWDKPTSRLVAIVDKIEDGVCFATYLSENTTIAHPRSPESVVTPLADFRMKVVVAADRKTFTVERTSNEITAAYYSDGELREWQQDSSDNSQPVRKAASIK